MIWRLRLCPYPNQWLLLYEYLCQEKKMKEKALFSKAKVRHLSSIFKILVSFPQQEKWWEPLPEAKDLEWPRLCTRGLERGLAVTNTYCSTWVWIPAPMIQARRLTYPRTGSPKVGRQEGGLVLAGFQPSLGSIIPRFKERTWFKEIDGDP